MVKEKIPKKMPLFKKPSLLLVDTDATQAYVFESNKLPEVRGASRILDTLNIEVGKSVTDKGGHTIFAGGGGVLAVLEQENAPTLVTEIEEMYPARTFTATASASCHSLPPDWENQFGKIIDWATHSLRRHKESKAPPPFFERMPFQAVCESCHVRPVDAHLLRNEVSQKLCQPCHLKWENGRKIDENLDDQFSWYGRFRSWLKEPAQLSLSYPTNDSVIVPLTVDEIGQASRTRQGYIGLIYLDGDSIGQLLSSLKFRTAYEALSEILTETTKAVVFQTLAELLPPAPAKGSEARKDVNQGHLVGQPIKIYPFEIITIGGDDVLVIVPGDAAIPVAQQIGSRFSQQVTPQVRQLLGDNQPAVTMSAGVVIADDHTPLAMLVELATDLLKKGAKKMGGALDFHVLKSVDMVDKNISHMRKQHPYYLANADKGKQGTDLRLVARPYRYEEVALLWEGLETLKAYGFAASQMQLLARSLLDGRRQSTMFFHYQHQRHKNKEKQAYDVLEQLLLNLQAGSVHDPLPWQAIQSEDYSYQTALWDIAELFDFVAAKEKA